MISKKVLLFLLLLTILTFCERKDSKVHNPIMIEIEKSSSHQDSLLVDAAEISLEMMEAALPFRLALKNDQQYRSGVYVYAKSVAAFIENPKKLAARIAVLGIKDIYLSVNSNAVSGTDSIKTDWVKQFNKFAHKYGLRVWALRLASYVHFVDNNLILNECERIISYNKRVSPCERFDGVSADWEPHVLKKGGKDTPTGIDYYWDNNNNYGIDGSNDMLLKRTLEMLNLAQNNLEGLPINEAIHYMYQNNFNSGNLSYGSTLQFLENCEYVIVMCYTDTKEKIWSRGLSPIENAYTKPKSVSVCIKTSLNTYGDNGDVSTSLHTKGWSYLVDVLNYIYTQSTTKPGFRGIDFFEYEGLEIMWQKYSNLN